jgi:hypothetical protein
MANRDTRKLQNNPATAFYKPLFWTCIGGNLPPPQNF